MLSINWDDVINVIVSVMPMLIAIVVVLALAVILTVAVNRRTVKDTAVRKLVHADLADRRPRRPGRRRGAVHRA